MTSFCKELTFLQKYFQANGYPRNVIFSQIGKFIKKQQNPNPIFLAAERKDVYLTLPFLGTSSDNLKHEIEKIVGKYFPFVKIHVVFKNLGSIGSFFRFKDVIPSSLKSSVVYEYCCPRCGSGRYIGSTIRPLYFRARGSFVSHR